jgi:pyruvate-ferredoxin/flavodoxin oxidoreductase
MRLTLDKQLEYTKELVNKLSDKIGKQLAQEILNADQTDEAGINSQRERIAELKHKLAKPETPAEKDLLGLADILVKKSLWILGGDGWAYDIGYGGLDHVLASGRNVNVLVLDTEVYSNTGGQSSKATPRAAVAKFAAKGKDAKKKDLAMMAMSYGNVYVAQVAMGANDRQTLNAFIEAESYDGPSIIIAYSHCIAHGIDMQKGLEQQDLAVKAGAWPLFRFDPRLAWEGKNPLQIDSRKPTISWDQYALNENRFRVLLKTYPHRAEELMDHAVNDIESRWTLYQQMAEMVYSPKNGNEEPAE